MSSELRDLYQEVIIDHNRKPRNYRALEHPNHTAEGFNPLCGDRITLYLEMDGEKIKDIGFQGSGCAISKASVSMMTDAVKGKTRAEADTLFEKVRKMLSRGPNEPFDSSGLGKLAVFSGVTEFPARVKCASLGWHTLKAGFTGAQAAVSTE